MTHRASKYLNYTVCFSYKIIIVLFTASLFLANVNADVVNYLKGEPLNSPWGVDSSPDGKQLYVSSLLNDSITVYTRDVAAQGSLSLLQTISNYPGLIQPMVLKTSPDGNFIYVAAQPGAKAGAVAGTEDTLAVFSKNSDGTLSSKTVYTNKSDNIDGLQGPADIALSPDGKHLYVTGNKANALVVFSRDVNSGLLTFLEVHKNGINNVDGLAEAQQIAVSPDGNFVYVTGSASNALAVFSYLPSTGGLNFVRTYKDGDNTATVDGLTHALAIAMSPKGDLLYVTGRNTTGQATLAVFRRDSSTGLLDFASVQTIGEQNLPAVDESLMVTISPDGTNIYTTSRLNSAFDLFRRNPMTGALALVERHTQGDSAGMATLSGLDTIGGLVITADGANVYSTGGGDGNIGEFSIDRVNLVLSSTTNINTAAPGQPVQYTLTVNNQGTVDATAVVLTDKLPVGTIVGSMLPDSCANQVGIVNCDLGVLKHGESTVVTVELSSNQEGDFTNQAMVYANQPDINLIDNQSMVSTTVQPLAVNNPPIAVEDNAFTLPDTGIILGVLANDTDNEGDALTVVSVDTQPSVNGSAAQLDPATGMISYTPPPNFVGNDSFRYTISDGTNVASATVTIHVTNPPAAVDDSTTTTQDTAIVINVLANDTDKDGDKLTISEIKTSDINGNETKGTVEIMQLDDGTQALKYTPAQGDTGADSFSYIISDPWSATSQARVDIKVTDPTGTDTNTNSAQQNPTAQDQGGSGGGGSFSWLLIILLTMCNLRKV